MRVGWSWVSKLGQPPPPPQCFGASWEPLRLARWKDSHLVPRDGPSWWPPGSPHLGHVLQQADVDGDQAREALVGEAQAFHEEQQLRRAARVLDHVVELPPAQDVDVPLAEKRVWRERGSCQAPAPARGVSVGQGTRGQSDSSSRHREISTSRKCHRKGHGTGHGPSTAARSPAVRTGPPL